MTDPTTLVRLAADQLSTGIRVPGAQDYLIAPPLARAVKSLLADVAARHVEYRISGFPVEKSVCECCCDVWPCLEILAHTELAEHVVRALGGEQQ